METAAESLATYEAAISEEQILTFLTMMTDILNPEHDWNLDELQSKLEEGRVDFGEAGKRKAAVPDTSLTTLNNRDLKKLLLTKDIVMTLKRCVEALVSVIFENLNKSYYRAVLRCATTLSRFLEICEKNNLDYGRTCVTKFLMDIMHQIGAVDTQYVKGATYQLLAKVVSTFKKVSFAKKIILCEISKKLKECSSSLVKSSSSEFQYVVCCESLLLHLMILKELLKWNLEVLVPLPVKISKKDENCLEEMKSSLNRISDRAPDYIAACCYECINLL